MSPGRARDDSASPLADQSELLLIVLVTHSMGSLKKANPFRRSLFAFTEDRGEFKESQVHLHTPRHMGGPNESKFHLGHRTSHT